jgi:hypothetical protein
VSPAAWAARNWAATTSITHHVDHRAGVLDQGRDRQRRIGQRERQVGRVNDVEGAHLVVGGQRLGQDGRGGRVRCRDGDGDHAGARLPAASRRRAGRAAHRGRIQRLGLVSARRRARHGRPGIRGRRARRPEPEHPARPAHPAGVLRAPLTPPGSPSSTPASGGGSPSAAWLP